jgi:catechol 2,3-dioxygenase-like lactoylglutathione lyase family enzyme
MDEKGAGRFSRLSQVGFVVRDLDKTMEAMRKVFGAEPDKMMHCPQEGRKYYGSDGDFTARIAFYEFCNVQLEFVEPLGGKSIWQDFLDQGREGLHHIRFSVDNFEETRQELLKKDIGMAQEGLSALVPGLRWGYFDSEDPLGFIFEIFNQYEQGDPGV